MLSLIVQALGEGGLSDHRRSWSSCARTAQCGATVEIEDGAGGRARARVGREEYISAGIVVRGRDGLQQKLALDRSRQVLALREAVEAAQAGRHVAGRDGVDADVG